MVPWSLTDPGNVPRKRSSVTSTIWKLSPLWTWTTNSRLAHSGWQLMPCTRNKTQRLRSVYEIGYHPIRQRYQGLLLITLLKVIASYHIKSLRQHAQHHQPLKDIFTKPSSCLFHPDFAYVRGHASEKTILKSPTSMPRLVG